jgi:hypothetical protein
MPEVIIDLNNIVPGLFQRLPELKARYKKVEGRNIYIAEKIPD